MICLHTAIRNLFKQSGRPKCRRHIFFTNYYDAKDNVQTMRFNSRRNAVIDMIINMVQAI